MKKAARMTRLAHRKGAVAAGLGPDPAPTAVPSYCPGTIAQNTPDRFHSCDTSVVINTVLNTSSGAVVGQAYILVFDWAELYYNYRVWVNAAKVNMFYAWGVDSAGVAVYAASGCFGGCAVYGAVPPDAWTWLAPGAPMQGAWVMGSLGTSIASGYQTIIMLTQAPGTPGPAYGSPAFLPVTRCDSETYLSNTSGCVYPSVPGVLQLSAAPNQPIESNVEDAARFIRDVQNSLPNHPGRFPDGVVLHRTTDDSANRAVSGPECDRRFGSPRPPGMDCDEYPFAATREGAATGNYDLRLVPSDQNQRVGRMLGSQFFLYNRILDGDPFYVQVQG